MAVPKRKRSGSGAETRTNPRRRSSARVIKNERQKQQRQQSDEEQQQQQKEQTFEVSPYDRIVDHIPISHLKPDYSKLQDKLSVFDSHILYNALTKSRYAFLTGKMFDVFWTRPVRGKRLAQGEVNARDRMTKFCECDITIGIHTFDVKLFLVRDSISQTKFDAASKKAPLGGKGTAPVVAVSSNPQIPAAGSPAGSPAPPPISTQTQSLNPETSSSTQNNNTCGPPDANERAAPSTSTPTGPSASPNPPPNVPPASIPSPAVSTTATAAPPPPPPNNEIPLSEENRIMVAKLHAIAKTDVTLSSLMKVVAAGQASHDQLLLFQRYITMARNSDMNYYYGNKKPSGQQQQPRQRNGNASRQSPAGESKAHTLVFEFKENPSDRFTLPKMSIVEPLSNGDILVSFLLLSKSNTKGEESGGQQQDQQQQQQQQDSSSIKQESSEETSSSTILYEPMTMRLAGIPHRLIDTVIKSVNEPGKVREYMTNIFSNNKVYKRSNHFWIWYHINPADSQGVEASKHVPQHPLAIATASSGYKRKYLPKKKRPSSIAPDSKKRESATVDSPVVSSAKPEQDQQQQHEPANNPPDKDGPS